MSSFFVQQEVWKLFWTFFRSHFKWKGNLSMLETKNLNSEGCRTKNLNHKGCETQNMALKGCKTTNIKLKGCEAK